MNQDKTLRLQTILKPTPEICSVPELYYHVHDNVIDFDGYFNLFAIDKWRAYTQIENLSVKLRGAGIREVILYCDRTPIAHVSAVPQADGFIYLDFPYDDPQHRLVFWFSLVPEDGVSTEEILSTLEGYYCTAPVRFVPRDVNIAAVICTFKREPYVYRNVKQLRDCILTNADLVVSSHFRVFIVDNGKTLKSHADLQALFASAKDQITVFENKNAGGAGGFTRGMMEAIKSQEQYDLTHVLLMDDDAINEPDAIVRLYALLQTRKDEWIDTAVGGSMMREDFPYLLYENGAEWKDDRVITYREKKNDVRLYENATVDYVMKPYGEHTRFSGWWFYCAPLTTIRRDNLPLEFFIHMDDIEYGVRNQAQGILFLNGIGIWHRAFDINDASMNVYSYARNGLIMMSIHSQGRSALVRSLRNLILRPVISYVIRYRYSDVKVIEKAVDDFLKGPEFLLHYDPEQMLKDIGSMSTRFYDLDHYADVLTEEEMEQVQKALDAFDSDSLLDAIYEPRSSGTPKIVFSLNGWIFPAKDEIMTIPVTTTPANLYRIKKAALFEPYSRKLIIGEKSYRKLFSSVTIYIRCLFRILTHLSVADDYKHAFDRMRSMDTWEEYLGLKQES